MAIGLRRKVFSNRKRRGFSLIEVMVAMVVLTVGLLSVASMFSANLLVMKYAEEDSIARQEAQQMIEGIFAGRNSGAINFAQIQTTDVDPVNGIFRPNFQPALQPGADGVMNTLDDGPGIDVGPDGKPLTNFQRMIQINPVLLQDGVTVDPNTKQIQIWVRYQVGGMPRTYTQVTYISTYR